jgi:hypothetical protein
MSVLTRATQHNIKETAFFIVISVRTSNLTIIESLNKSILYSAQDLYLILPEYEAGNQQLISKETCDGCKWGKVSRDMLETSSSFDRLSWVLVTEPSVAHYMCSSLAMCMSTLGNWCISLCLNFNEKFAYHYSIIPWAANVDGVKGFCVLLLCGSTFSSAVTNDAMISITEAIHVTSGNWELSLQRK